MNCKALCARNGKEVVNYVIKNSQIDVVIVNIKYFNRGLK